MASPRGGRRPAEASLALEDAGVQRALDRQLHFLIADYLSQSAARIESAALVSEEMRAKGLFGDVVGWDGERRHASLRDLRGRYVEVAPDQLRRLLEEALHARATSLETGEAAAREAAAATATLRGGDAESEVVTCPEAARLHDLRSKLPASLLQRPGDLLDPTAAIARASASAAARVPGQTRASSSSAPSSATAAADAAPNSRSARAARLVRLRQEVRDIETELRRVGKSAKTDESGALPVYLAKRIKDRRARLEHVRSLLAAARRSLRDDLVARHRMSASITDLFSSAQRGERIDQKLTAPARELVCKRMRVMKKIYGHKAYVFCVTVDKTGRWIVTGSDDALCKLWNARTGDLHVTFRAHEKMICDVAIDNSNRYLASSSVDNTVRLWELHTGRHISVLLPHRKCINVVKFDPCENLLMSASDDGMICIWDTERIIQEDTDQIASMRASQGSSRAEPGSAAATVRAPTSGTETSTFQPATRPSLASLSASATTSSSSSSSASSLTSQQSGPVVAANAVAAAGITTRFLSPRVPTVLPHLRHDAIVEVNIMSVAPQGGLVVAGCDDGVARVWAVSRKIPEECAGVPNAPTRPNLVEGEYVDGAGRLVCTLRGHLDSVTLAEWSKTGDRLLTGSVIDGTVRIWYWPQRAGMDGTDYCSTPHQRVLGLARNTNTAFAGAQGNHAEARPEGRRRPPNKFKLPSLDVCAWSGDDQFVIVLQSMKLRKEWDQSEYENAAEFFDQRVLIFDSYTGELLHNIGAHRKPAFVLRAHPTDKTLFMTGGHDGQICVWDVYSGRLLRKISVPSQYGPLTILDGGFTPEGSSSTAIVATDVGGRLILIGSQDTTVYAGAYPEQFLSADYNELLRDAYGNVLDARTQLPPHLITNVSLVDSQGAEYPVQPRHVQPSAENAQAMLAERRNQIRQIERQLRNNERAAMERYRDRFQEIDKRIADSNTETQLAPSRHAARGATRLARNVLGAGGGGGSGGGGGGGGGAGGPAPRRGVMGYAPAPGNSSTGLLACERAEQEQLQQIREQMQQRQQQEDEEGGANGGPDDHRNTSRRRGRAAAQQARNQIRQFQELESRPAPVSGPNLSSDSEGDTNDEQWDAQHAGEGPEDDDDDDEDAMAMSDRVGGGPSRRRRARRPRSQRAPHRAAQRRSTRPRAARNGRHFDYVEFDDEDDDAEDLDAFNSAYDEHDDEPRRARSRTAQRTGRSNNSSTRRRSSVEEPSNTISVLRYYDRSWLQRTAGRVLSESYCPQLGDMVVYCVQGHHAYLRHFPVSEAAPWQLPWWQNTWPVVLCRLDKVDYIFPDDEHQRRLTEGDPKVESSLELTVLATPSRELLHGTLPVARDALWQRTPPEVVSSGRARFKVTYHAFNGAEFILLRERFEAGMAQMLQRDDTVHAVYEGRLGEPVVYPGRVVGLGSIDHQWPGSPWETVSVRWDTERDSEQQSVWELRKSARVQDFHIDLVENDQVSQALAQRLARRLDDIKLEQCAQPFIEPVNLQAVPTYGTIVPLPMDLSTVLNRLRGGYYRHVRAIERDVRLIREDCITFNDSRSTICAYASELEQMLLQIILDEMRQDPQEEGQMQRQQQQHATDDDEEEGEDDDGDDEEEERRRPGAAPTAPPGHGRRRGALAGRGGAATSDAPNISLTALVSGLRGVLAKLKRQDRYKIFAEPVDPVEVPGYDEIIDRPMDFATVANKLNNGEYGVQDYADTLSVQAGTTIAEAFEADLTLVYDNAVLFNQEDSPVYRAAINGKNLLDREMPKFAREVLHVSDWKPAALQNLASQENGAGRRPPASGRAKDEDDDEDEDNESHYAEDDSDDDDDDDDDEDYGQTPAAKRRHRPAARGTKRARDSGSRTPAPRAKRRSNGFVHAAKSESESEEEDDDDDYDGDAHGRQQQPAARGTKRARSNGSRARPPRAKRGANGFVQAASSESEEDDDDDYGGDAYVPRGTRSRGRR